MGQIDGPAIDTHWIKHPRHLLPSKRSKAHPCSHESEAMTTLYERGPFLRPTLRNAVVNERILAKLDSAPVADLGGKAIGTMNANGGVARHDIVQPIQYLLRGSEVLNFHRIIDDVGSSLLIEQRLFPRHRLKRLQCEGRHGYHLAICG